MEESSRGELQRRAATSLKALHPIVVKHAGAVVSEIGGEEGSKSTGWCPDVKEIRDTDVLGYEES